jgi:hypothetical protein
MPSRNPSASSSKNPADVQPPADSASAVADNAVAVDADERRRRISERAFYKAEQRGFAPDNAERDWLEAEQETDGEDGKSSRP